MERTSPSSAPVPASALSLGFWSTTGYRSVLYLVNVGILLLPSCGEDGLILMTPKGPFERCVRTASLLLPRETKKVIGTFIDGKEFSSY